MSTREKYLEEVVRQLEFDEKELKAHLADYEQLFETVYPLIQRTVEVLESVSSKTRSFAFAGSVVLVYSPRELRKWWTEQGLPLLVDVKSFQESVNQ